VKFKLPKKIYNAFVFLTVFSVFIFSSFSFMVAPVRAGAITGISYPSSGSTVATFVPSSSNLVLFTPGTALVDESVITITFPDGTVIDEAKTKKSDFDIVQAAGGGCSDPGADTNPDSIDVNVANRTIAFTVNYKSLSELSGSTCGFGEVTIKVRVSAGADEIQHPSTPTTSGVLQIDSSEGGDTGSITNVTFVAGAASQLAFTTQASTFATVNVDFTNQPVVEVQDDAGNPVDSTASITLSAVLATDTGTAGSGTLNATTNPLSATAGVATFSGVNYTADEDIILKATAAGLTTAFSDPVIVSVPDSTPPEISSVEPVEDENSATITWDTNEDASSQVEYGLTDSYGTSTDEVNTVPRVKNHSVAIPSLASCTKYNYRAKSVDRANNNKNGNKKKLVTKGCVGNASVISDTDANVNPGSGGTVELLDGDKGVEVEAPIGYSATSANFQVKKLEKDPVIATISSPGSYTLAGDHIYDLKALTNVSTSLTSFDQPVTVTITYDDSDLALINGETSLRIFRHNGSAWSELSNCSVNTLANEVTCSTTSFSVFGLFGQIFARVSSSAGAPTCNDSTPGTKAPWLYAATPESTTSIRLRFVKGDGPFDRYALEYGTSPGNYIFAADNISGKNSESYVVRSLVPHMIYYFRIRAGNGCATGPWSNEIFAATLSSIKEKIDFPSLEITTKEGDSEIAEGKYNVTVKVVDQDGKPVAGVKVVLFSAPREGITNKEGVVEFDEVEFGSHRLVVSYQDKQSELTINLSGDKREVNLAVSIERKTISPFTIVLTSAATVIITVGAYYVYKKYQLKG
jgi:hypothetical protein